jgi:hypothetical protein
MAKRPGTKSGSRAGSKSAKPNLGASEEKPDDTRPLAKSADPSYVKFTTYIRKTTHVGVKTRLVSKGEELSDLVEELLSNWLRENGSITT